MTPFDEACVLVAEILRGGARAEALDRAAQAPDMRHALATLEHIMSAESWSTTPTGRELRAVVAELDTRTRADAFHALHDWDGIAARLNPDTIPVDVVHYLATERGGDPVDRAALAILVDFHFLYVLGLLSLRVWDAGDPNAHLDRVTTLLHDLQGPQGSGHQFAANAETLLLVATSHYEPDERGYHELLTRTRDLDAPHQLTMAMVHAASMGSHLRFGVEATYGRDLGAMRVDNAADYPWLGYSLSVLLREYARLNEGGAGVDTRDPIVEAIVCALSPDAAAFTGSSSHAAAAGDRKLVSLHLHTYRAQLLADCERHRPTATTYSPVSLFFNFAFNVVKGTVIDALLWGEARRVSLNDLFTGLPRSADASATKTQLAQTLTTYARAHPDTIRGKRTPVVVYDPAGGRMAFGNMMRALRAEI